MYKAEEIKGMFDRKNKLYIYMYMINTANSFFLKKT